MFRNLGYTLALSNPTFPNQLKLKDSTQTLLEKDNKHWIGIAPFAQYQSKMYPLDLLKQVVEALSKEYKILLFGGGIGEINALNEFQKSFENVTNIAGKLSIDEELDLISNLDVMLSMDSGNAHIAAMLGIKVVTIWGVTHPFAGFAPFNQPEDFALLADRITYPKIPTSIYGNKYPESYKGASGSILPETIIQKIKSLV